MILEALHNMVVTVITTTFGWLPSLPEMSETIVDIGEWIVDIVTAPVQSVSMFYGRTLWNVILVMVVAIFNYEKIFKGTMFILKKIPFLNIK